MLTEAEFIRLKKDENVFQNICIYIYMKFVNVMQSWILCIITPVSSVTYKFLIIINVENSCAASFLFNFFQDNLHR